MFYIKIIGVNELNYTMLTIKLKEETFVIALIQRVLAATFHALNVYL